MTVSSGGREAVTVRVVPIEPTEAMLEAGWTANDMPTRGNLVAETWKRMVDAAPSPAVPAPAGEAVAILDETSLRARIGEIGNQVHNVACEHQNDDGLTDRLSQIRDALWALARQASPAPAAEGLREARRETFIDTLRGELGAVMDETEDGTAFKDDPNFEDRVEGVLRAVLPFTRFADGPSPAAPSPVVPAGDAGRFAAWSAADLAGQCRMQARDSLDPEYEAFMFACADRLAAPSRAEAPADAALDRLERGVASTDYAAGYDEGFHRGQEVAPAPAAEGLREAVPSGSNLDCIRWYVECLEAVAFNKHPVRGLSEAEEGYKRAFAALTPPAESAPSGEAVEPVAYRYRFEDCATWYVQRTRPELADSSNVICEPLVPLARLEALQRENARLDDMVKHAVAETSRACREAASGVLVASEKRAQDAEARIVNLTTTLSEQNEEVSQILGKALGYPWFKDDQATFPGATEEQGVCVGDHVAETLATEAAAALASAEKRAEEERDGLTPGEAWSDLVNKDDRTSPEDYPDMALITEAELADYMRAAARATRGGQK